MPDDAATRWTVSVSKETDDAVRSFLAERGLETGDLSKFVEEAVNWHVFKQTLTEVRSKFADLSPDEVQALVDEALTAVREGHVLDAE